MREFLARDDGQQRRSMVAACPPFRRPCTLSPMVDAIRQATASPGQLGLSGLAGALRPLFPEWSADLPPAPEPAEDATAARHRLFRALDELLACLGVTVLVVEDVHWADEATLEFLLFLGSQQAPRRSLVLTYRPEDVPGDSLLLRLSSRMPGGAGGLRLALQPLGVAETLQLVSSMLGGEQVPAAFAEFLHSVPTACRWPWRRPCCSCTTVPAWRAATGAGCAGAWTRSWSRPRSGTGCWSGAAASARTPGRPRRGGGAGRPGGRGDAARGRRADGRPASAPPWPRCCAAGCLPRTAGHGVVPAPAGRAGGVRGDGGAGTAGTAPPGGPHAGAPVAAADRPAGPPLPGGGAARPSGAVTRSRPPTWPCPRATRPPRARSCSTC